MQRSPLRKPAAWTAPGLALALALAGLSLLTPACDPSDGLPIFQTGGSGGAGTGGAGTGGTTGTGGTPTGGTTTGGTTATGGAKPTGGTATGGTTPTGGVATGGTKPTGGTIGTGGKTPTGGTATGGIPTGGAGGSSGGTGGSGTLCTSSSSCPTGMKCTTEDGDCRGCGSSTAACPAVCFGICVMRAPDCTNLPVPAVDCVQGYKPSIACDTTGKTPAWKVSCSKNYSCTRATDCESSELCAGTCGLIAIPLAPRDPADAAGAPIAPPQGKCTPKPTACDKIYKPVCGCDGRTYGSDCERQRAGVPGITSEKSCDDTGVQCGGLRGLSCPKGSFCDFLDNTCGAADQLGVCKTMPTECSPTVYEPVCGCDGKTYPSDCGRSYAGISKQKDGTCR